ncbi:ATP-binding protein [Actinomadura violacea]|uniref:ATP-binding protein n=1 Tax=Actinomadura violacea TaxID=2819934 RepID=A0ABS3S7K3_9ACTN|nr:ATP-binding protein [Actinomadura violacea]MBO2464983.1 ATP-binding protein [Actinomadura violacea]
MTVLPVPCQAQMPPSAFQPSQPSAQPSAPMQRSVRPSPKRPPLFTRDPRDPDRDCEALKLAALPSAAATARRFAAAQLRKWGLGPLTDDVALVTSELVTNAIVEVGSDTIPGDYAALHDHTPPVITLQLRLTVRRLLCEVWDPSPVPPVPARPHEPDSPAPGDPARADLALEDLAESGRGLGLIASLASRWASYPSPAGGKAVIAWWDLAR